MEKADVLEVYAPDRDLPLFPTADGHVVSKEAMTRTIRHAAQLLKIELDSPDGTERVSGHSLRATGAQGLARAGVDLWAVELLGRWGGPTVRRYVREAQLEDSAAWASRVAAMTGLPELVRQLTLDTPRPENAEQALASAAAVTAPSSYRELTPALQDTVSRALMGHPPEEGQPPFVDIGDWAR